MCVISLIEFTDKYQGHVRTLYTKYVTKCGCFNQIPVAGCKKCFEHWHCDPFNQQ